MTLVQFNRNPLWMSAHQSIPQPSDEEIQRTPSLFNASLEDALLYGGDLTRQALGAMNFRGDRKYIIVDTKVHMLMPGMWPAIPGWHTDGVPRPKGIPDLSAQEEMSPPRFHLLVTGQGCLTDFLTGNWTIDIPDGIGNKLYEHITKVVNEKIAAEPSHYDDWIVEVPSCRVVQWDWWDIHRAKAATKREWRFLIRVTETNHRAPKADLRDILRTQQQVYVPSDAFGW